MAKKGDKSVKKTNGKSSKKANVKRVVKAAAKYDADKSFAENQEVVKGTVKAAVTSAARASGKKQKKTFTVIAVLLVIALIAAFVYGYLNGWFTLKNTDASFDESGAAIIPDTVKVDGELEIHFLELGNKNTGDSIYIKAGETDMLIDAGSLQSSAPVIKEYVDKFCTDGKLEYVVATHADKDHIAGFVGSDGKGIFDSYVCETVIDFARSNKDENTAGGGRTLYGKYLDKRQAEVDAGATHYTAAECVNLTSGAKTVYKLSDNVEMEILNNFYYFHDSPDENNYSVCILINHYSEDRSAVRHFLFTGDLEEKGEEYLADTNDLPEVELFKAGHHGSKTSSTEKLLSEIKPKAVCVCCCAGSAEYTDVKENQFPTQLFVDRVSKYTKLVFVTTLFDASLPNEYTSMNGTVRMRSYPDGAKIAGSFNTTLLKDTDWFKNNRTCPASWAA